MRDNPDVGLNPKETRNPPAAATRPLYFTSEMTVLPEHLGEFLIELRKANERARRQPGCIYLYCHQSADDPCTVLMFEHWASDEAFRAQELSAPWMTEYLARTRTFHARPRLVRRWTPLD